MPCPSVFARGGERQIRPFRIEVKAFGVLLHCKSDRPWGSPWGLLSVLTASSHTSHGPSQNICSKDCEISPAWACPVSQHATTHGQTSSVPAEGTEAVVGHDTEHFALHWRLHGGMAWSSRSELVLAIRRGGHCRDWFAWCKDMYPPFPLAT